MLSYAGNFTGFPTDFVAYGTLHSPMGRARTDISFVPVSGNNIRYNGKLETAGFELGRLLKANGLGKISFNGMVNGLYNKTRRPSTATSGAASRNSKPLATPTARSSLTATSTTAVSTGM